MRSTPWIVALLVSVLLNGALAGFVIHRVTDGPQIRLSSEGRPPPPPRGGPERAFNARAFLQALPEERRQAAQQRLRAETETVRALMIEAAQARRAAEAAFLAEPYDAAAAQQAMRTMRESRFVIEAHIEAVVLEIVSDLPRADRIRAIEAMRRPGPPGLRGERPRDRMRERMQERREQRGEGPPPGGG